MYKDFYHLYDDAAADVNIFLNKPQYFIFPLLNSDVGIIGCLLWLLVVTALFCWTMSILTDNLSQVRKLLFLH